MDGDEARVIFVDGIQALGVDNGVARIQMMRLSAEGKPVPALELLIPLPQTKTFVDALSKIVKK